MDKVYAKLFLDYGQLVDQRKEARGQRCDDDAWDAIELRQHGAKGMKMERFTGVALKMILVSPVSFFASSMYFSVSSGISFPS